MTSIESVVKTNFPNEQEKALANVLFSGNYIHNILNNLLRPFGLKAIHFQILNVLKESNGIPFSHETIRDRVLYRNSLFTKYYGKLQELNLIEILEYSFGENIKYRITPAGIKMLNEIEHNMFDYFDPLKNRLNSNEARTLNYILDKLRG